MGWLGKVSERGLFAALVLNPLRGTLRMYGVLVIVAASVGWLSSLRGDVSVVAAAVGRLSTFAAVEQFLAASLSGRKKRRIVDRIVGIEMRI